tara:strand:- start:1997 stop:2485 length:489 start_codon:yes stop_codon:yes gene_type:complete
MKKLIHLLFIVFISSCGEIKFVYEDNKNLINPLFEKTEVNASGLDVAYISSYIPMIFGENIENDYILSINIEEKKTKRSVETNQATSNLRYELRFYYSLTSNIKNCVTYEKEIVSYFSIIPKSEGYNYGSDSSLEKKYELAISDNLNQFVSFLSNINVNICK